MGFFGKIVGKAVNDAIYKASDGKKPVSTDYTKAAINIIKKRIENITLFVSIFATLVFLGFYAFMICSKIDSIVNVIIYSVLSFLLIVSTILDIILFSASRKEMNFLEKRAFTSLKKIKRNSLLIFKLVIKVASIGYAFFIIATAGQTTGRIMSIAASILALLVQLAVHYLACFINDCINYMVIGVSEDVDNSGILFLVDKNKHEKNASNEILRTRSDKKILEELEAQKQKDSNVKDSDDEIKIKYGKYHLECKNKANEALTNDKKLIKLITDAQNLYNQTKESNKTPDLILNIINLVSDVFNKKYDKLSNESYINSVAFLVYYTTIYDYNSIFSESNERFILEKIVNELTGLEEYINNNK